MKTKILALLVISTLSLTACMETMSGVGNKQIAGGATGAVLGGLAGSQFGKGNGQLVGVGVGALLGTLVGSEVGASLDKADMAYAQQATDRAYTAPVGQACKNADGSWAIVGQ